MLQGTFTSVTGTFKVPAPHAPEGSVAVWVGIDGKTCPPVLQTGVVVDFLNGSVSYNGKLFDISALACNLHTH